MPSRPRRLRFTLASLLFAAGLWGGPLRAAEVLEVRLDGLTLPIRLDQLEAWSQRALRPVRAGEVAGRSAAASDLEVWLDLLTPESRADLARLLLSPLLEDRSFGRQLLDSWAGGPMLAEVGGLLTTPSGESTTASLQLTLRRLLEQRREVTALELLRGLPEQRLSLQLDRLLALAERWRLQLERQKVAVRRLHQLPLPTAAAPGPAPLRARRVSLDAFQPRRRLLPVDHRREPLPLDVWLPPAGVAPDGSSRPWLLLMPGLGGDADHLGWLAGALARRGWAVAVLQHPGSDGAAVRSTLAGRRPPPGAETLAARLKDAEAVLAAQGDGRLSLPGRGVVLMGHSLGAVTALMAAGLAPEAGLGLRCGSAAERLPLSNPSRLLQCQLPEERLPPVPVRPAGLRAVVLLNGFGSLYWPRHALSPLGVPVLMVGGSLDLITPPLDEQLALFLPQGNPRSRLVMVEGGSHFSPVRMSDPEEALFRIGSDLVGVSPENVQKALLSVTGTFLEGLDRPVPLAPQRLRQGDVVVYVLDPGTARRWRAGLGG